MKIKKRKLEHINISLSKNVQFREKSTGLEEVGFSDVEPEYKSLPEIDLKEVKTETQFLGKKFSAPLMVSGMTGGTERAKKINKDIAKACERTGIGMGLGSMRAMLEERQLRETYFVRDVAPGIFLAGNIGATQLREYSNTELNHALKDVGADALAVHLNSAQEAMQFEGSTDFRDCIKEIKRTVRGIKKPVYVKEVGHGISAGIAKELEKTGIKAVDVAGAGGTSWAGIDSLRGHRGLGKVFWDFGVPTAVSVLAVRKHFKGKIIASGGIRNGLDVVKSMVLGADLGEIALPALKAQAKGGNKQGRGAEKYLEQKKKEIKTAMFLVGAKNLGELKKKKYFLFGKTREWAEQL